MRVVQITIFVTIKKYFNLKIICLFTNSDILRNFSQQAQTIPRLIIFAIAKNYLIFRNTQKNFINTLSLSISRSNQFKKARRSPYTAPPLVKEIKMAEPAPPTPPDNNAPRKYFLDKYLGPISLVVDYPALSY